ncbi:MAG: hypothetical protein JWO30_130 [Fibrobacteres bacterium]|nr:hypothetical protein [Fibrobacterota bacterium]
MHFHMPTLRGIARVRLSGPGRVPALVSKTLAAFPALPALLAAALFLLPNSPQAGVTNPDISALGQVIGGYTDDANSSAKDEPTLRSGEMEMVLDAYLNPYIKGWFTISGSEDGFALEEGYASVVKGLPWGLNMKAGKYRLGFGKINPMHPHAYPFIDPPRSLVSLLPGGEEGFNETGVQVSELLPTLGDWASTLSADLIEAKQFHPDRDFTRLGWLGRWANDFLIGDIGAVETGVSAATGKVIAPDWDPAYLYGADVKAKFYLPGASQLTVQAEGVYRRFQESRSDFPAAGDTSIVQDHRTGFVTFADYRYHTQWNGGLFYEQWDRDGVSNATDRAFRVFAGYAVLEESTLLRLMYEHFIPALSGEDPVNTVSLQLLFSMGPHKAHQF